jgi:hypothetical protein
MYMEGNNRVEPKYPDALATLLFPVIVEISFKVTA